MKSFWISFSIFCFFILFSTIDCKQNSFHKEKYDEKKGEKTIRNDVSDSSSLDFFTKDTLYHPNDRENIRERPFLPDRKSRDNSINETIFSTERNIPIDANCPDKQTPCPNFPTKVLFNFKVKRTNPQESLTITWLGVYKEHILALIKRKYKGNNGNIISGEIYSFSSKTGKQLWMQKVGAGTPILPVVTESGIILLGVCQYNQSPSKSYQTILSGINIDTGQWIWQNVSIIKDQCYRRAATINNNIFLVDKDIRAIKASTGKVLWKHNYDISNKNYKEIYRAGPVIGKTKIYAISPDGRLIQYNLDGKKNWEINNLQPFLQWSAMAVGKNENLYIHNGVSIFSINSNGTILWSYPPKNSTYKTLPGLLHLTLDENDNIYFRNTSIDSKGRYLWKTDKNIDLGAYKAPLVFSNGLLYLGSTYGQELSLFSKKGKWIKAYLGYPNEYSEKNGKSWSSLFGTFLLTPKNQIISFLTNESEAQEVEFLFIGIDLGIRNLPNGWPTIYGNQNQSSSRH